MKVIVSATVINARCSLHECSMQYQKEEREWGFIHSLTCHECCEDQEYEFSVYWEEVL